MSSGQQDREDEVLSSFMEMLADSGTAARLIENPDRLAEAERTFPAVTTDAVIDVGGDGQIWATDVTVLALPGGWSPALDAMDEHFSSVARARGVDVELDGDLPEPGDVRRLASKLSTIIQSEGLSGSAQLADTLNASWAPAATGGRGESNFTVNMPMPSADLSEQIAHTLRPTMLKKASGQGQRARDAGLRYVLLLDWLGGDGIAQGTHWLPRFSGTVHLAVRTLRSEMEEFPDAVYLLDRKGAWTLAYPEGGA